MVVRGFFLKVAFLPPDKCEVIDQFILFAFDRSALFLRLKVNSGGLRGVSTSPDLPSLNPLPLVSFTPPHTRTHT